ncbi:hypothetical protein GBF38_012462 [Nibea albiflora]|uniref:Uncharacterized protein n=1 Tax=Nibea albiflora TaxID=240163 RepID=A0ACB7EMN0_NIBAL|nr:hypothetical protein GBF38_012462 [Nibea albiflora]
MDVEMLILEVQNQPIIYDTAHPFYKDTNIKDAAWNDIAGAMGVDVDLCKTKWRRLEDSFVKSQEKESASGSAGESQKDWIYKKIMSFLLPHLHPRSSLGTVVAEERLSSPESACGSDRPSTASVQRSGSPSPSQSTAQTQSVLGPLTSGERDRPYRSRSPRGARTDPRGSQRQRTTDVEERLLSILQEPTPKPVSDLDECYYFAMSIVPQLHRMDRDKRHQAKVGILKLLYNIESGSTQQSPQQTYLQPQPRPGPFRPFSHPTTVGPFTQMLASEDDAEVGEASTHYTDL